MITREHTVALMIDMQERLLPVMNNKEEIIANSVKLLKGLNVLNVPIKVSQQYTRGLGETINEIKTVIPDFTYTEKKEFSAAEVPEMEMQLAQLNRNYVIVFGIETHVCVLQTCLSILNQGFQPVLVTDCTSSRKPSDKEIAIQRLQNAGVIITTYESILFELLKSAEAKEFKEISNIIK